MAVAAVQVRRGAFLGLPLYFPKIVISLDTVSMTFVEMFL